MCESVVPTLMLLLSWSYDVHARIPRNPPITKGEKSLTNNNLAQQLAGRGRHMMFGHQFKTEEKDAETISKKKRKDAERGCILAGITTLIAHSGPPNAGSAASKA
jgi:hypothetical protein